MPCAEKIVRFDCHRRTPLTALHPAKGNQTGQFPPRKVCVNRSDINIVTLEDPVKYDVSSLNQAMVNDRIGHGFQEVLRKHPDAILVKSERRERCGKTGHSRRMSIHEFLKATQQVREAILRERNYDEIMAIAVRQGFNQLRHDGFRKASRGLTSLDKVARATAAPGGGS